MKRKQETGTKAPSLAGRCSRQSQPNEELLVKICWHVWGLYWYSECQQYPSQFRTVAFCHPVGRLTTWREGGWGKWEESSATQKYSPPPAPFTVVVCSRYLSVWKNARAAVTPHSHGTLDGLPAWSRSADLACSCGLRTFWHAGEKENKT